MERVVIHTSATCGYCHAALALLRQRGVPFRQVDVTGDRAARAALAQRTGRTTVPQIFVDGRPIGGFTDLLSLVRTGRFDDLMREPPAPAT